MNLTFKKIHYFVYVCINCHASQYWLEESTCLFKLSFTNLKAGFVMLLGQRKTSSKHVNINLHILITQIKKISIKRKNNYNYSIRIDSSITI